MTEKQLAVIAFVVSRAPEWIRRDLSSTNLALKQRAEDALVAMVAAAIRGVNQARGYGSPLRVGVRRAST